MKIVYFLFYKEREKTFAPSVRPKSQMYNYLLLLLFLRQLDAKTNGTNKNAICFNGLM